MKRLFAFLILLVALPAIAATEPEKLIRQTSDRVIAEIKDNAATYQQNPGNIYRLVDEVVLPHFDFIAMTDLALGRYKDEVSVEQKPTIVSEFRQLLVRTYSSALLEYTDQALIYLPMEGSEADGKVVVRTEIQRSWGLRLDVLKIPPLSR